MGYHVEEDEEESMDSLMKESLKLYANAAAKSSIGREESILTVSLE
jgi:hypothetical protein